ncbi:MAG: GDP-L-fucose synthase family protein [Candidatus Puniceispirillales bacterium]
MFDLNNKKIFVSGHKGMVGSSIVEQLNSLNLKVLTVEKNDLDLTDFSLVNNWFEKNKPEVVIIAAAKVGGIHANSSYPVQFLLDNLKIQNNLIEISYKHDVKKLLFLGSSCIYPKKSPQPIKEEYLLTSPLEPTNEWYALAKISGLKLCQAYRKQYGCDFISLMPTNLYGPNDNFHPIDSHVPAALLRRFHVAKINKHENVEVWGTGKPKREFMHVSDLANATIFLLQNYSSISHINVGIGKEISIFDFAHLLKEIVGFDGNIVFDETKPDGTYLKRLDTSKINEMGWHANIQLENGLKMTYEWALKNKVFENEI